MLTYPKSTMRVWRMPMHLSSGHVILMPEKFYPSPSNFPQSDLGRRADSRWALPLISSFIGIRSFSVKMVADNHRHTAYHNKHY